MLDDVAGVLACPVCASPVVLDAGSLRCPANHVFDVAREGYVSLLGAAGAVATADTREMIRARREFFATGHFDRLVNAFAEVSNRQVQQVPGVLLDVGGGPGEYLCAVLDTMPSRYGIVLDASKVAAKAAARAHPRMAAVVANAWGALPVRDASCALVMSVFAPRNAEEFARVLTDAGTLLVVVPNPDHLRQIATPMGLLEIDADKRERLDAKLGGVFVLESEIVVDYEVRFSRRDALLAAMMGPAAVHATELEIERRAAALPDVTRTTVSASILTYRHAPRRGPT